MKENMGNKKCECRMETRREKIADVYKTTNVTDKRLNHFIC